MIKRALTPTLRRLRAEALLHAALFGFASGCAAELLFLGAMLALAAQPGARAFLAVFAAAALLAAVLGYALRFRPTLRVAAGRLDAAGLEERIRTMLDCAPAATPLHEAQRADALAHLSAFAPGRLPLRVPRRLLALCLLGALAVAGVAALPGELLVPAAPLQTESEEERLMREMLDMLRAQIEAAGLEAEERERLLEQLAEAENALAEGDASLEQLAQITQAAGEITQAIDEIEQAKHWIYALTAYDNLKPLAEAILEEDAERVDAVLEEMETGLLALSGSSLQDELTALWMPIQAELEAGDPDDSEAYLCYAFDGFANDLARAAGYVHSRMDPTRLLHAGFARMKNRLAIYLAGETVVDESAEPGETRYVQQPDGDSGEDEQAEGENASSGEETSDGEGQAHRLLYSDDPDGMLGAGVGTRAQQHHIDTERIYEPSLNPEADNGYTPGAPGADGSAQRQPAPQQESEASVPYDRVYGLYYAQLLDQITSRAIPPEDAGLVEAYFYGL